MLYEMITATKSNMLSVYLNLMKILSGEWQVRPFRYLAYAYIYTLEIQLGLPLTFDSLDFMIEIKA